MAKTSYAIALGSNRRSRHGSPGATVRAALDALAVDAASRIRATPAMGPAGRSFANAAAILTSPLDPPELLERLKAMERDFGRRGGRKWGPRVLDLDIVMWSAGPWGGPGPIIPHPAFRERRFVLEPLAEIAPGWRDPVSGATVRHLLHRLAWPRPVDRVSTRT
ncbi:MAG TPA: 2-amino-4-hydroxy-6-hydroxymethyldihydropteridine diphosphokinase [Allosphingosinicella sp.]|jgi:2-amino-4-hydroxy-6-hydroxymethyldihydropteridine diphosphokinase|nr:2-amino-4-hydroxy-6-hydroxymethyldihydropteridine diphosphokinase [Allosphingosinicella sp.]